MRSWMIAFSLGVLAASRLPLLPDTSLSLALLVVAVLLQTWPCLRLPAALLAGGAWLCLVGEHAMEQRWPLPPYPRDVWVEATVATLPTVRHDVQRLQLQLDKVCASASLASCDFAALPDDGRRVLLSVYEPLDLQPGQRWRWLLRLRPPHGFVNPGGFDYEAWLLQSGISATGYLRSHRDNRLLQSDSGRFALERWRHLLTSLLDDPDLQLQRRDLLKALTLGDGSSIADADWQLFAATGTTHLLVISGSHVALICLLLYAGSYWLASRSAWLLLRVPATWPATLVALTGSWLYTGLAGFSLPAQRAWLMAAVLLLAQLWRRHLQRWHGIVLALFIVLLADPLAVLNTGFWLSFVAVAVLLSAITAQPLAQQLPLWRRAVHWLWQLWVLQWRLSVALLPIVLVYFQQTSVLAPFVNLPLVPLLGVVVVPLALGGTLLLLLWRALALMLLKLADQLLVQCMSLLQWSDALLPRSMLVLPSLQSVGFLLLVLLTITFLLARQRWQRLLAAAAMPIVCWWQAVEPPTAGELQLHVLDVGQGLAVVASTAHHHLVYDTGPMFSDRFDAGNDVVLPVLRKLNVPTLDRVIVSHADQDHAGGLQALTPIYPDALYSSSATRLFDDAVAHEACRAGQAWQWDGVKFRVLHPDASKYDDNNGSCVLLIEAGGRRVLLAGDIEKPVESALLRRFPELQADVVVAPHHGSASSSTGIFVRQLQPAAVIFSTGFQNRFGHPSPAVVTRYRKAGAQAFNTAEDGAIGVKVTPSGGLLVTEERLASPRFWRQQKAEK